MTDPAPSPAPSSPSPPPDKNAIQTDESATDTQSQPASSPASPRASSSESAAPEENGPQDNGPREALATLPSHRIQFESQANILTADSLEILDEIAEILIRYPETELVIEGHTDSTGTPEENLALSLLRATTVRDYLVKKGVSIYSLRAIGYGEGAPIADNRTAEGRATNRRIEFTF